VAEGQIVVRGRTYEREPVDPAPAPPRPIDDRSRWRRTEVSFGPVGRLLCTAVLLLAPWRFAATGSVFWFLATVASVGPGVWWFRETWRRT
jgi:hypothetical protein